MNMSFLNITLCYYYFLEAVSQGVVKKNPTKTELDAVTQATLKHMPACWLIKENM